MSKHRHYSFILYPESASILDLIDFLNSSSIPSFVSPLHDHDLDSNNKLKKPHYHILLNYSYPIEYNSALKSFSSFNISHLDVIYSNNSYYRYLTHEDNPDKFHYSQSNIVSCGGAVPPRSVGISDTAQKIIELSDIITCNEIGEFSDLIQLLISKKNYDLLDYVSKKAYFVDKIIASKRYSRIRKNSLQGKAL